MDDDVRGNQEHGTHNWMGGRADAVIQAQKIYGGIHFHGSDGRPRVPRQVPAPTRNFVNQLGVLAAADRAASAVHRDSGLHFMVLYGLSGSGRRAVIRVWVDRNVDLFPDGLFYADLSAGAGQVGLESATLREFLLEAGYHPVVIPDSLEGRAACFRTWSAGRRVGVVLDNALTAAQVKWLTPGPGASVVMVSSSGRLAGLGPKADVTHVELPRLDDVAARRLLAGWVDDERLTDEPQAVASLLRICEGLPLALCVLGATLEASPYRLLADMVAQLDDERQRLEALSMTEDLSVKAVFKSAYDRLPAQAQRCYKVLGLHPGSSPIGIAVLAAALHLPADDARRAAAELVKVSLIREISRNRYLMTGLVRVHAHDVAKEEDSRPDRNQVVERILAFYHDRVVVAGDAVMPDRDWNHLLFADLASDRRLAEQMLGADPWHWLEVERDNLRVCVEAAYRLAEFQRVCDMCVMLWPLHEQGKQLEDQIAVNTLGLEAARQLGNRELEALIGIQLGFPYLHLGNAGNAHAIFSAALVAARSTGNRKLQATALESLGLACLAHGRPAEARTLLRENLDLAMDLGKPRRTALALYHLAKAEPPDVAEPLLRSALDGFLALTVPDPYNVAKARLLLGRKLTDLGLFDQADGVLQQALQEMTPQGRPFDCLQILESLGDLARAGDDVAAGLGNYQEALAIADAYGFELEIGRLRGKIDDASGPPKGDAGLGQGATDPD